MAGPPSLLMYQILYIRFHVVRRWRPGKSDGTMAPWLGVRRPHQLRMGASRSGSKARRHDSGASSELQRTSVRNQVAGANDHGVPDDRGESFQRPFRMTPELPELPSGRQDSKSQTMLQVRTWLELIKRATCLKRGIYDGSELL